MAADPATGRIMSTVGQSVYLLDDDPEVLKALSRLLRAEGFPVRAFSSAHEFLAEYRPDEPACVLLDVAMPEMDGLELQRRLTNTGTVPPIVFLTGRGDIPTSVRAMKSGASDFLTKPVDDVTLLRTVRSALRAAVEQRHAISETAAIVARYHSLTPREREVMAQVVDGMLNKQIAAALGASEKTIKVHRARVMEKMGVESVADLVRAAGKLGLGD
jgi:FixJ family two-component response regulator